MTADDPTLPPRRRPKGDKRARTRARIIQATAELVQEQGFDQTTVQAVARRAGVSNGAIYGNFSNRTDLLAAIGPTYWPQVRPQFAPGSSFAGKLRTVAEALIAVLPERRRLGASRLTGLAYALANEELRARALQISAARYGAAAEAWQALGGDEPPPMPPELLVKVLNCLIEGLTLQALLTPELITDEVIFAAFAALAPGPD